MKTERSVGAIMSPFQMVGGGETVDSAMHVMREHGLNAILVEPNAEIANRYLITCSRDTPLLHVARQMMNNGIRRIVVMEGGQPLGIVTEADLFRLVEQSGWGPGVA
jgi:CBS domain-containing protein